MIFEEFSDAVILFTDNPGESYFKVFEEAAQKLRGGVLFVVSGTKDGV
jgi:hypothetical protein